MWNNLVKTNHPRLFGSVEPTQNVTRRLSAVVSLAVLHVCTMSSLASAAFLFNGNSADGHPVSGSAEFAVNPGADTITVTLTNTTAITHDAGELFTGVDFSLGGLAPSLVSDMAIQRTVTGDGSFVDTLTAHDLSWSLVSLGSNNFQLNFNPNAKDSIIGPPTAGSYGGTNGSIKGNPGHNPFAAEVAVFVLKVPNLETSTPVSVAAFRFGTAHSPAVPEPSTLTLAAMAMIVVLAWRWRLR